MTRNLHELKGEVLQELRLASPRGEVLPHKTIYHVSNPPKTEASADERLDYLSRQMVRIETQLDTVDLCMFRNRQQYISWRKRASESLSGNKSEEVFLKTWLRHKKEAARQIRREAKALEEKKGQLDAPKAVKPEVEKKAEPPAAKPPATKKDAGKTLALATIVEPTRKRTEQIQEEYSPVYTKENPPTSLDAARARRSDLGLIRKELVSLSAKISTATVLSHIDIGKARKPINALIAEIELELQIIALYLKSHPSAQLERFDWKPICFAALERAIANGLELTPQEQIVFDELKKLQIETT